MTFTKLPRFTKSLTVKKAPAQSNPVYHEAVIEQKPLPALKKGEILVKIGAAAFNHRDVSGANLVSKEYLKAIEQGLDTQRTIPPYRVW